ncbi:MAG: PAS domain S-box protein [Desulfobacteraceae bacterium]|nr:MAG: PAS domain S-box protein [Desulfobacteraceae bacterium]
MIIPLLIILLAISMVLLLLTFVRNRKLDEKFRQTSATNRQQENRFRVIFEAVDDAMLLYSPEIVRIIEFNPSLCDVFGYSPEEIHHLNIGILFSSDPPYSSAEGEPKLTAALNGQPQVFEWETRDASGNKLPVELRIQGIFPDEKPLLLVVVRKIAKQKQIEGRLNRFVNIIDQIGEGVATADLNGIITYANQAWADMHGYSPQTIVGKHLSMFHTDAQNLNEVIPINKKVLRNGHHRGEVGHRRSDGSVFSTYMTSTLQKDDNGRVIGFIGVATDLSEQKKVEDALRASEIKFRHLFNISPQPISVTDLNGTVLDVNQKFCEKMQYTRYEIIGKSTLDLGFPAEDRQRYMDLLIEKGDIAGFEISYKVKNGQFIQVLLYSRLVQIKNDFFTLNVFHDITTQRQLETQLIQSQKMEAIGTLAGGIAHDFNNILSAILGYIELAKIYTEADGKVFQYLEEVFKAGNRAKDLVRQILSISRQAEQRRKPVDLGIIIRDVLGMMRPTMPPSIEIHENINENAGMVEADPVQMHQVIMNLVTNAGQSMKGRSGTLTVSLERETLQADDRRENMELSPGNYVKLTVSDTGHGIDTKDKKWIFDPYFTTKDQCVGTGLGLAVVQSIIKKHGGAVLFSSEPGKGSDFYIYLPLLHVVKIREIEPLAQEESLLPVGTERILLVDDEDSIIETGREMLEYLGYSVETCAKSVDAWCQFLQSPDHFDLVISDMTMPEMNGDELAKKMIAIRPELPVVICTGYNPRIDEAAAKAMGLKAFIFKPLTFQKLATTVRNVLDGKM